MLTRRADRPSPDGHRLAEGDLVTGAGLDEASVAAPTRTGVAHSIVGVAQFHDYAALVLERFHFGRLVVAPPLRSQPVHIHDVADHLLEVLAGGPVASAASARSSSG